MSTIGFSDAAHGTGGQRSGDGSTPATGKPAADPRRVLEVEAFVCRIEDAMKTVTELLPGRAATRLLARLKDADLGDVSTTDGITCLTMFGIRATSTGTPYAVLRNWSGAAKIWLRDQQAATEAGT